MSTQVKLPLYLSWRKLEDVLGWPYSRTHILAACFDRAPVLWRKRTLKQYERKASRIKINSGHQLVAA
jgi:hypothetical protein